MGVGKWIFVSACAICMLSCSTTRVLQDGEFRLAKNKVEVTNDKSFNTGQIEPYLKQKPNSYFIFGWNPFLNIYNWSNGKGTGWDRFVQKIGVAPVVYDSEMVGSSVENITRHLEYLGYFHSTVDTKIEVKKRKVYVGYYVTLGKQYPVKSLIINVPDGEFAEEFCKDTASLAVRKGVPLSESSAGRLFSPYYTTKSGSEGTGLGLAISKHFIEQSMGGDIRLENYRNGVRCVMTINEEEE